MKETKKHKAFTLIEVLIVISIAGMLATMTLQLNRSRIAEMKEMNEREIRLDRHNHTNRELTNTNYIDWNKISYMIWNYKDKSSWVVWSWFDVTEKEVYSKNISLSHYSFSWDIRIKKTPLSLWCEILWDNTNTSARESVNINLLSNNSERKSCFKLDTTLCQWSKC